MAWRPRAKLFRAIWPLIWTYEPEVEFRREITVALLDLFLRYETDPMDLRGLHPEVDQALDVLESKQPEPDIRATSHEA